jgi:hypothetical protein
MNRGANCRHLVARQGVAAPKQLFTGGFGASRFALASMLSDPCRGSKEYDFSDMAANGQIANEEGGPLDLRTVSGPATSVNYRT